MKEEFRNKNTNIFDEIQKNFFLNKNNHNDLELKEHNHQSIDNSLKDNDAIDEKNFDEDIIKNNKNFPITNKQESSMNYNSNINSRFLEDLVREKNQLKHIITNYMFRLKEYIKKNSSEIKNYFVNDLGENTKKNKNYSYNTIKIEDKIESIYSSMFNIKNNFQSLYNHDKMKQINENKERINLPQNPEMSFDYIQKLDEILIHSKSIIDKKYSFLRDTNYSKNNLCISLLRYLLEHYGLKIKLQIFKDLFDINISSISKTCKFFKESNLI